MVNLHLLAKRAERKLIGRRGFLRGAVALGLTASSALLLFQACGGDDATPAPTAASTTAAAGEPPTAVPPTNTPQPAQEGLVRRLPELAQLPVDMLEAYPVKTEGKSVIYVAIFGAHPQIKFYDQLFRGEAERMGMEYSFVDSAFDAAKELENLELAISRGFDVILLHPTDPAGASPAVERAREGDQIFINVQTDTVVRPTIKHGWNWYDNAVLTAHWMGQNLPEGSKVVGAVGELITSAGRARKQGFLDTIPQYGGIEVLDFIDGCGWNQEGGYECGVSILSRFPELTAIAALEDQQGIGMRKAAEDQGRTEGLVITGGDGQREGQEAVGDGRLDMAFMMERGFGPEALGMMDMMEAAVRGDVHADAVQMAHFPPQLIVTKDNIAEQWMSPI